MRQNRGTKTGTHEMTRNVSKPLGTSSDQNQKQDINIGTNVPVYKPGPRTSDLILLPGTTRMTRAMPNMTLLKRLLVNIRQKR